MALVARVVAGAPTLLAEPVVDGALAAGLYRRVRHIQPQHGLRTTLRHTLWPFVLALLVLVGFGWIAQRQHPDADSIGDVFARDAGAAQAHPAGVARAGTQSGDAAATCVRATGHLP